MIYWSKKPSEVIPKTIDFTDSLPVGESAVSAVVTACDEDGEDVSEDVFDDLSVVSPNVTVTLLVNGAAAVYALKYLITTTSGFVIEEDVELTVREAV
jgi:hypothetical protein